MKKLTKKDRELVLQEENKARLLELQKAKKDLWKMRTKEKKLQQEVKPSRVQQLGLKAEKIANLLQKERERVQQEKELKEREQQKREQQRKERVHR